MDAHYVLPAFWNSGFGCSLFQSDQGFLKDQAYSQMLIWVVNANTLARYFYETMGCHTDGMEKTWQAGAALDAVRYNKKL